MTDRDSDFEELRPTGEASHIPSGGLSECVDREPDRQRIAMATTGYPETPTETDTECRSCGAPIPADPTKCLFCLISCCNLLPLTQVLASLLGAAKIEVKRS
ncbi:hypothetical protein NJ7G_2330 [Natrinema sp. J7-2]|nr:hypothetical protein NJ7G_2330 [Natrinema sp. J7-2]